ncbi:hypothetical protein B0H16DRAFT_880438 [Mycena metata]|uniref:Uncharacterized protein n=1 Tax=Mycena metata TaxID=1033252 RepID=A0AAD7K6K5_9AGAR|nr:hypothetical protein B0H16DRAFT_880438 [Mycena metata]
MHLGVINPQVGARKPQIQRNDAPNNRLCYPPRRRRRAGVGAVQSQRPLVMNGVPNGIYAYSYSNNSILEIISSGGPGNTAPLTTWAVNRSPATMSALGITNVTPSTYIAGYGYLTLQSALAQRIFYQTTNGNIVSAFHSGLSNSPGWAVDTTIATNLPLGTPISAFINIGVAKGLQLAVVQYTDANGLLTSTFSSPTWLEHSYHGPSLIVECCYSRQRFTVSEMTPRN